VIIVSLSVSRTAHLGVQSLLYVIGVMMAFMVNRALQSSVMSKIVKLVAVSQTTAISVIWASQELIVWSNKTSLWWSVTFQTVLLAA
jgi:type III secretory pathway component EscS